MGDYIRRKAAIAFIREQSEEMQKVFENQGGESGFYADAYNDLAEDFYRVPAADAEPVRHGWWDVNRRCSECGAPAPLAYAEPDRWKSPYCPSCGAKMDLEG